MQRPPDAGTALAWRALSWRAILLLALRGRLGRIVRRLRRAAQRVEPRLQRRDACVLRRNPLLRRCKFRGQRQDQRVLLGVRQLAEVGRQDHPAFRIDSIVIVSRISCAGPHASLTVEPITCSKAAVITLGEQIPPSALHYMQ